ncbi:MAG: response regulator [Gemmatimonadetes bacterium]|nr:response regulator [Gemmatimonadota bacterium]
MELTDGVPAAARHPLPADLLHDLRTPLNHIIGYSEMLIDQAEESGSHGLVPDLRRVLDAGNRLLALINDNTRPVRLPDLAVLAPAARERRRPRRERGAPEASEHDGALAAPLRGTLLVVDDVESNRDVLSRRLERQGYDVATAESGKEALDMMRAHHYELVLLDIMMPEMDGYEVLRRLKADDDLQHIPVIMISALSEMESVARCIEMGAEDYLPKPFNPILLKARIGASLEKKRARDREVYLFQQLQQNYARLQELEKLRDDLTNMIIHDLRTPLTAVINGMQTMEVMGELNDPQRRMMNIAVSGGETLLEMINELLDVEKLESGSMRLDAVLISPAELVGAAVAQVATLAESKRLTLEREIADDLPLLAGDEGKLRRALVNLLGNAIKFTPPGGKVTVSAHQRVEERVLVFSVCDTGEGIPPEAFGRIFEKFGQVETRKGGRAMSTGLGLTFCRLAVEAHGGQIDVESTLGVGSTFRFTIPLPHQRG